VAAFSAYAGSNFTTIGETKFAANIATVWSSDKYSFRKTFYGAYWPA
jgi:hypothetical protein